MSALFGVDASPEAVDAGAQAAYGAVCVSGGPTPLPPTSWADVDEKMREHFRLIAAAVLGTQDFGSAGAS